MPRGIFRHLTINEPPPGDNPKALDTWLRQTVHELQRFSKDIETFLVQDIAVARVSDQVMVNGDQIMSDGLFVNLYAATNITANGTRAFKPGVVGSWLILQNVGPGTITIPNGAGTNFSTAINLAPNDIVIVRYYGTEWLQVTPKSNN